MSIQLDRVRDFVASARPRASGGTPPRTRVIAVGSGKGGVGTSTIACLLGATMASAGRDVLLVDAGDRLGALHLMLGVEPRAPLGGLRGGAAEPESLIVPVAPSLSLMPNGAADDGEAALSRAERRLLLRRVTALYTRYDLVVVDAGATVDSIVACCADGVSAFLAVTGGDRISVIATYALVKLLGARSPATHVEVVANRLDDETASRAHDYLNAAGERFLGRPIPFAGSIPDDPDFGSALAAGLGAIDAADGSSSAQALHRIGERILSALDSPSRTSSASSRLLRRG